MANSASAVPAFQLALTESSTCVATITDPKDAEKKQLVEMDIFKAPMVPMKKRKPKTALEEDTYVAVSRRGGGFFYTIS
jgi:hypothetical protein